MASINDDSSPERSGIPWGTIASTLVLLFLFVGLLAIMMNAMRHIEPGEDSQAGEKQLQEVRAFNKDVLTSEGYDPQTKTYRVPVTRAMEAIAQAGAAGKPPYLPVAPQAKPEEKKPEEKKQ